MKITSVIITVISSLLIACGDLQQPPVRVGINPWVGYDALVLARERGWVDAKSVQIVELMSNSESARALRNDLLDGAALTLDEALRLADAGVPVKIVAILDFSDGADAVVARAGIDAPADLAGKRIALEKTALGALLLDRVLASGGLRADQIKSFHVEASQHAEILMNGRADAVVTFEPMKSQLLEAGYHSLFDSSQVPGDVVDVLVVRADVPPERTADLLWAWECGRRALIRQPEFAANLLAAGTDLTAAQYLTTFKGLRLLSLAQSAAWLHGPNAPLLEHADGLVKTLLRLGLLQRAPDWQTLLSDDAGKMKLEKACES